jgi:hypothetical protein
MKKMSAPLIVTPTFEGTSFTQPLQAGGGKGVPSPPYHES